MANPSEPSKKNAVEASQHSICRLNLARQVTHMSSIVDLEESIVSSALTGRDQFSSSLAFDFEVSRLERGDFFVEDVVESDEPFPVAHVVAHGIFVSCVDENSDTSF